MKFKWIVLICVLMLFPCPVSATTPIFGVDGEDAASIGVYISDIPEGDVLIEYNSVKTLTPASIMKALTTASAISALGTEYRFRTEVYMTGEIAGSTLCGNLLLKGYGDPTLESRHFPDNKGFVDSVVSHIKKYGITCIKGSVIAEQSFVKNQGPVSKWEIEDEAWGYGAGYYGLNFMDNTFRLSIPSMATVPHVAGLTVVDNTMIGKNDPKLQRGTDSYVLEISGTVPAGKEVSVSCAMPEPSRVLIDSIYCKLSENGIKVECGDIFSTDTVPLFTYKSPFLSEIMRSLMFRSDNLMAEGVLRAISVGSTRAEAIDAEIAMWENRNIDCSYVSIYDGSGLARSNRVSPKFMGDVLSWMAKNDMAKVYVSLFPRAGKEGTLSRFLANSRLTGRIVLKTGSMNGVQCYAGYKLDSDGKPTHVIVIMVNNFFCKRKELINSIERLLLKIF